MYGLFWRILPGPAWFRAIIALAIALVAIYACFKWVYPVLADWMPFNDGTVDHQQ